jgi:parvulin-like peptidyl-prolyl isomerase
VKHAGFPRPRALLAFSLLITVAAGPAPEASSTDTIIARRGAITLGNADVQATLGQLDPTERQRLQHSPTALDAFVREQVLQQSLLQEAKEARWDQKPDIAAKATQAHDAVVASTYLASLTAPDPSYPSDADVQSAYDANKTRFLIPRQYHLAQIYIAVPTDAGPAAFEDAQKRLQGIRQQLGRPHADFAEMARKTPPGSDGDLGWVREDQVMPQIRDAIAGLQAGGVTDPIRTPDGWHLVKLVETKPATTAPLADVREALVRALRQQRATQAAQAYLAKMQSTEPVQINEIQLSQTLTK